MGVSRSRNIGALASLDDCTHLFFTNDDIVLEPKCLEIFVTHQYGAAPKSLLLAVASQIVDHLRGGNSAYPRDVFFKLGGFNWLYSVNGFKEETDFCLD